MLLAVWQLCKAWDNAYLGVSMKSNEICCWVDVCGLSYLDCFDTVDWAGGAAGRVLDLWSTGRGFKFYSGKAA